MFSLEKSQKDWLNFASHGAQFRNIKNWLCCGESLRKRVEISICIVAQRILLVRGCYLTHGSTHTHKILSFGGWRARSNRVIDNDMRSKNASNKKLTSRIRSSTKEFPWLVAFWSFAMASQPALVWLIAAQMSSVAAPTLVYCAAHMAVNKNKKVPIAIWVIGWHFKIASPPINTALGVIIEAIYDAIMYLRDGNHMNSGRTTRERLCFLIIHFSACPAGRPRALFVISATLLSRAKRYLCSWLSLTRHQRSKSAPRETSVGRVCAAHILNFAPMAALMARKCL